MEVIAKLGSILGLSFVSGINLYATVAVTGLCYRMQLVSGLPPELAVLGNDAVIFIALVLYVMEFLADKIPGFDTAWDSIHTFIRPFGGALLALIQVGEATPAVQVIAFMLGASMASATHITKAGTRLFVNASPEPVSNIVLSTGEDVFAVGFTYLALAYPRLTFFLTAALFALIMYVMPMMLRTFRMMLASLAFRLKAALDKSATADAKAVLPLAFDSVFERVRAPKEQLVWTGRAYAARIPGIPRFASLWVAVTSDAVYFLYRRWFKVKSRRLPRQEIRQQKRYPGALLGKWLLATPAEDWLALVYQPLSQTLPQDLTSQDEVA